MHRLFLDANILFSAAYKATKLRSLWESGIDLLSSPYAIAEARRNIIAVRGEVTDILDALLKDVQLTSEGKLTDIPEAVSLPDKDKPILAAAIHTRATHLLTGDFKHFGQYFGQTIVGVCVLPPADYFCLVEQS